MVLHNGFDRIGCVRFPSNDIAGRHMIRGG